LKPEECENLELGIGIEKKYLGLEVTHFKNEFKNLITHYTDPATGQSTYKNIGSATTEGDEFTLSVMPTEDISILLNLTLLTKAKDNATGERLLLRPERRANLNIRWKPSEKVTLFIDEIYVGERLDYGNVELPKYTLFNTRISYRLSETLTLSGRIENLFDEKYEEVKGYGTPGRSLYGGIRLEL
ncbi:MAG: TonB-dependent receptor, partial [bacterium]